MRLPWSLGIYTHLWTQLRLSTNNFYFEILLEINLMTIKDWKELKNLGVGVLVWNWSIDYIFIFITNLYVLYLFLFEEVLWTLGKVVSVVFLFHVNHESQVKVKLNFFFLSSSN